MSPPAWLLLAIGLAAPSEGDRYAVDGAPSRDCLDAGAELDPHEVALYCPAAGYASRCPELAEACARAARAQEASADQAGRRATDEGAEGESAADGPADDQAGTAGSPRGERRSARRALREQRERGERARGERRTNGDADTAARGEGERTEENEEREAPSEPERDRPSLSLPVWLRQLASLLFYLALALLGVAVVWMLLKHLASGRDEPDRAPASNDEAEPEAEQPSLARVVETDVERLLARSRARAAAGDHRGAFDDVYAAVLRRLELAGVIELYAWRTNGDYLRALAKRPELRQELRPLVHEVERVQFGEEPVDGARWARFLERARPLLERALALILVCGALVSLGACDGSARGAPPERVALRQASGYDAWLSLVERAGLEGRYRRAPLDELAPPGTALILPEAELDEPAERALSRFVARGGNVILLGRRSERLAGGVGPRRSESTSFQLELRGSRDLRAGLRAPVVAPRFDLDAAPSGDDLLRRDGAPYAIELRPEGGGAVLVFADEALFTNAGLSIGDNPDFASRLLRSLGDGPVELVDSATGLGASSPIDAVRRAELTPVLVQLLVLFALYVGWRGSAFGRRTDPTRQARRAYSEHARALGALYQRARAAPHAAGLVSSLALERLRAREAVSERLGLVDLAERIARRSGRPLADVVDVLERAHRRRGELSESMLRARRGVPAPSGGRAATARDEEREALELLAELDTFSALGTRERHSPRRSEGSPPPDTNHRRAREHKAPEEPR